MKHIFFFFTLAFTFSLPGATWNLTEKLAFDDVLLEPCYSEISPHQVATKTNVTPRIALAIPIISAAMKSVTESCLAIALAEYGGIGIIHQDMSIEEQCYHVRTVKQFKSTVVKGSLTDHTRSAQHSSEPLRVGAAIDADNTSKKRVHALAKENVDVIVINAIHGHTKKVIDLIKWIKNKYPNLEIIAGNIATADGALALVQAGADAVKVGVGPGALSPVGLLTGVGIPQISAIREVAEALKGSGVPLIANGGVRAPGDMCKALAAGADAVMIGLLFDETQESPCDIELYKSSDSNQQDRTDENSQLCCNNTVADVITQLMTGLRTCMSYIGCKTVEEMHEKARFIHITDAAMLENY